MSGLKNTTLEAVLAFFYLLFNFTASAQNLSPDSIEKKMMWYSLKKPSSIVFAHFDKTLYAQNENAWFTAYLLNSGTNDKPNVLSLSLVNDLTKSIVLQQKFLMADGISFGNVFLPDTIPAGSYSFILYTNQLYKGKPKDIFVQHITLANTNELTFKVSLSLDTINVDSANRKIILDVLTKYGRPVADAKVNYIIGKINGNAQTDNEGKCFIISPICEINADNSILKAKIQYNKDEQNINLAIPFENNQVNVKFYPEGGYLIHATASWVGWEVKTGDGTPLKVKGILYKDDLPVDTIETDSYGMGRFKMIPMNGSLYKVKLLLKRFNATVYKLPTIIPKGAAISITDALANDTLKIKLTSKYSKAVTVLVHNYRQIFYSFPVRATAVGKVVLIDLKNVPKGLATITVLDSVQQPCAERLFFAHYNERDLLDVNTDKLQYAKREKVKLTLKFKTRDTGLVSVACVQSNRLQIKNSNNIESYVYLKHELNELPLNENYMGNSPVNKTCLENILLIKGWRRYTWQEMAKTNITDTALQQRSLFFAGKVTHLGEPLKKSIRFIVMTDSTTITSTTDEKGAFKLNNNQIITDENKKVRFLIMTRNENDFILNVDDPYIKINQLAANELQSRSSGLSLQNDNEALALKGFEHAIALREVKVKGVKDNSLLNSSSAEKIMPTENECGDYICMFGILNCPNHKGFANNIIPVVGEYYIIRGRKVKYFGCTPFSPKNKNIELSAIQGIKYSKEFYGSDYSVVNPSQPEYLSTLFWKHLVKVNPVNDTQLEFYTSDITGPFKIVVQGVTEKDVVYSEKEFSVK